MEKEANAERKRAPRLEFRRELIAVVNANVKPTAVAKSDQRSEHAPFPHRGGAFWILERHAVVAEAA